MKNKINIYKIISVVFIMMLLGLAFLIYRQSQATYDFGVVKIKKSSVNAISETMDDKPFKICEMESNQCVVIGRIK